MLYKIMMNGLYIVELNKDEYSTIIKIIIENKTKVKRTLITNDDVELIIYCDNKFVDLLKSKDIEINPYKLTGLNKKSKL